MKYFIDVLSSYDGFSFQLYTVRHISRFDLVFFVKMASIIHILLFEFLFHKLLVLLLFIISNLYFIIVSNAPAAYLFISLSTCRLFMS